MDDKTDSYLRISLKNWAAHHQPPEHGRERLLHQARVSTLLEKTNLSTSDPPDNDFILVWQHRQLPGQTTKHTIANIWSLSLALSLRLVT